VPVLSRRNRRYNRGEFRPVTGQSNYTAEGRSLRESLIMPKLNISLGQMNIALGDVRKNYARVQEWTEEAARRGSHLVLFPELWLTGYALAQGKELGAALNSGLFAEVAALAQQH